MDINFKKSGTSFKNLNRTCTFEMAKKKKKSLYYNRIATGIPKSYAFWNMYCINL